MRDTRGLGACSRELQYQSRLGSQGPLAAANQRRKGDPTRWVPRLGKESGLAMFIATSSFGGLAGPARAAIGHGRPLTQCYFQAAAGRFGGPSVFPHQANPKLSLFTPSTLHGSPITPPSLDTSHKTQRTEKKFNPKPTSTHTPAVHTLPPSHYSVFTPEGFLYGQRRTASSSSIIARITKP